MAIMDIDISLIVPTRGRPMEMLRFLNSVIATAAQPDRIEIVMVTDDDDPSYDNFHFAGLTLTRITVPSGSSMGSLNMAGYRQSRGRYLMLMNDDVVVKTREWDVKISAVFRSFPDGIVLVHTEDGIFHETLCTFPFVTREFCELADGICPEAYRRYRIDDHLYNVFNLLALLHHKRIVYLPDVVFEHLNVVTGQDGKPSYVPDPLIHSLDTQVFDDLLEQRKQLAVKLAKAIVSSRRASEANVWRQVLAPVVDSVSLRRPEYVRTLVGGRPRIGETRVTIGVVSANLNGEHASICIDLLKKYTTNFDLIVIDNNWGSNFNHSREMNRLLAMCRTDYLVLMDDDVWVTPNWLDGLFSAMGPDVGVVTPLHRDRSGNISYAGVVMRPDMTGHHSHSFAVPNEPVAIQTLCSAVMLIDVNRVGHLKVDESYSKYFMDIDYGLRVWEAGFRVMLAPASICTHLGGATLAHQSDKSNELFEAQRIHWVREWMPTGRYQRLIEDRWTSEPNVRHILEIDSRINELFDRLPGESIDQYLGRSIPAMRDAQAIPTLLHHTQTRIADAVGGQFVSVYDEKSGHLMALYGMCGAPTQINGNWGGYNIYVSGDKFFGVPVENEVPTQDELHRNLVSGMIEAKSVEAVRTRIDLGLSPSAADATSASDHPSSPLSSPAKLVAHEVAGKLIFEGYFGYNIIRCGHYYGIRQGDGAFDLERARQNGYRDLVRADSLDAAKRAIRRQWPRHIAYQFERILGRVRHRVHPIRFSHRHAVNTDSRVIARVNAIHPDRLPKQNESTSTRNEAASRAELVIEDHDGFSIFLFEHKYFCIPVAEATQGFKFNKYVSGGYSTHMVGHSLVEARQQIDSLHERAMGRVETVLLICLLDCQSMQTMVRRYSELGANIMALTEEGSEIAKWSEVRALTVDTKSIVDYARQMNTLPEFLASQDIDRVVIPWSFPECWNGNSVELLASRIAPVIDIVMPNGQVRTYFGENLHRIIYNKAYLSSMFQIAPDPRGMNILEVGCSDGLVCDLLQATGAEHVTGIDVMTTAGCSFPNPKVTFAVMNGDQLRFPNGTFDLVFSIATLEHVANPAAVINEMLRVTRPGGIVYVQAGPLYHSPYGHHMFSYFADEPWIHLRMTAAEIVEFAQRRGIAAQIERDLGIPAHKYIYGMLTPDHVNGLFLEQYGLESFRNLPDVEVLKYLVSREGEGCLTPSLETMLSNYSTDQLTEHGFELFIQVKPR